MEETPYCNCFLYIISGTRVIRVVRVIVVIFWSRHTQLELGHDCKHIAFAHLMHSSTTDTAQISRDTMRPRSCWIFRLCKMWGGRPRPGKLCLLSISLFLFPSRPVGNIASLQHRDDGQGFVAATEFHTCEKDAVGTWSFAFRDSSRLPSSSRAPRL